MKEKSEDNDKEYKICVITSDGKELKKFGDNTPKEITKEEIIYETLTNCLSIEQTQTLVCKMLFGIY